MLSIDGSEGEGGGQVLRTALALSAVTGTPFRIERIRGGRSKPGLLRQHLTAVNAMTEICDARVEGAELGSQTLSFAPRAVKHGEHTFAVGTAGSATLVFQTVLPALLAAEGCSRIRFEGGTHNPMSPPFEHLAQTFLPLLGRMGARVSVALLRAGFYPAGGGAFEASIESSGVLAKLELLERGAIEKLRIRAVVANLSDRIAEREAKTLASALCDHPLDFETERLESAGPGNVAFVAVHAEHITETFVGFGEIGVRAEKVVHRLAGQVRKHLATDAPVSEHLADQLLIPCALAGGGAYRASVISEHTRTNAAIIERFLKVKVAIEDERGAFTVRVSEA
jgi:RNA 3'-terminal phosphate cyclase (ATP)